MMIRADDAGLQEAVVAFGEIGVEDQGADVLLGVIHAVNG